MSGKDMSKDQESVELERARGSASEGCSAGAPSVYWSPFQFNSSESGRVYWFNSSSISFS
jgi:hypothetical protein